QPTTATQAPAPVAAPLPQPPLAGGSQTPQQAPNLKEVFRGLSSSTVRPPSPDSLSTAEASPARPDEPAPADESSAEPQQPEPDGPAHPFTFDLPAVAAGGCH